MFECLHVDPTVGNRGADLVRSVPASSGDGQGLQSRGAAPGRHAKQAAPRNLQLDSTGGMQASPPTSGLIMDLML